MSYKLDIQDDLMSIQGLYGTYEASNNEKGGFMISVVLGSYVYELDAEGEDYIVENGQEWAVPAKNLTELNEFIRMCEDEKLWNYMSGPVFRMKPDTENGILYIKGQTKNFVIGEHEKKLYVDEVQSSKTHYYVEDLFDAAKKMTTEDKWWSRKGEETVDIVRNMRCAIMVTSGGNLQIEYRNKSLLIGQKDDGTYWVNMIGGQEKHIFYKDSFKEVIALLAA